MASHELSPLVVNTASPFGEGVILKKWQPESYSGLDYDLPVAVSDTVNPQIISGLTPEQQTFLAQNGFVVIHSQEERFGSIRADTYHNGQPYFVTTDAALHALHIGFDGLLETLERDVLLPEMTAITQAALDELLTYLPVVKDKALKEDTLLAAAYLSVALKLFDPNFEPDQRVAPLVDAQIEQIMAQGGWETSLLFPRMSDDYSAYKPVGHYAGDPVLEQYFRGMTWLGRVHFRLPEPQDSPTSSLPSAIRVPLIVTLALRRAELPDGRSAAEAWTAVHEALTFIIGPSDDAGPVEYAALMDQVYGTAPNPQDLADDDLWKEFTSRAEAELPAPHINSTFLTSVANLSEYKGWRFMGQRFTIDAYIFQNLVFDVVDAGESGPRWLPTGPDVMAVMGSPVALQAVEQAAMADYPNYTEQVAFLKQGVEAQTEEEWLARVYESWLYSFFPILAAKGDSYPAFMRTDAWAYREMNTALGSWAELKHDTILYAEIPGSAAACSPPVSPLPPGYVEANPDAFYRMAYTARNLVEGINQRDLRESDVVYTKPTVTVGETLGHLERLADRFEAFGDIAAKELRGESLTREDFVVVRAYLMPGYVRDLEPVPIVAAVADGGAEVLEVGTGYIDRMYVIVPINGDLAIAQGGVYSYYEFTQPRGERLTDQAWRDRLSQNAPPLPVWSSNFLFEGGETVDWLAFRVGDIYGVSGLDTLVDLRETPSLNGNLLAQLDPGYYFTIVDGPIDADGYTWWQVEAVDYSDCEKALMEPEIITGWLVEDQNSYRRSNWE